MKKPLVAIACGVALLTGCGNSAKLTQDQENERTQDAQIAALYDCARNEAYAQDGRWEQPQFEQCLDDWFDANGKDWGVDY